MPKLVYFNPSEEVGNTIIFPIVQNNKNLKLISIDSSGQSILKINQPHKNKIYHALFNNLEEYIGNSTEKMLVTSGNQRRLHIWKIIITKRNNFTEITNQKLFTINLKQSAYYLSWSHQSNKLLSSFMKPSTQVQVWDIEDPQITKPIQIYNIRGHYGHIYWVQFAFFDENIVFTASEDQTFVQWNLKDIKNQNLAKYKKENNVNKQQQKEQNDININQFKNEVNKEMKNIEEEKQSINNHEEIQKK